MIKLGRQRRSIDWGKEVPKNGGINFPFSSRKEKQGACVINLSELHWTVQRYCLWGLWGRSSALGHMTRGLIWNKWTFGANQGPRTRLWPCVGCGSSTCVYEINIKRKWGLEMKIVKCLKFSFLFYLTLSLNVQAMCLLTQLGDQKAFLVGGVSGVTELRLIPPLADQYGLRQWTIDQNVTLDKFYTTCSSPRLQMTTFLYSLEDSLTCHSHISASFTQVFLYKCSES